MSTRCYCYWYFLITSATFICEVFHYDTTLPDFILLQFALTVLLSNCNYIIRIEYYTLLEYTVISTNY